MYVVVTIPTFNEAEIIESTVKEIRRELAGTCECDILIQDDASTDETFAIAQQIANFAYRNQEHLGLAGTFREEIKNCLRHGADIIVHTDADGQYPARYIPQLVQKIREGHDLAIGSRFLNGVRYGNARFRGAQNVMFSALIRHMTGFPITDITSGFRAMNRRTASEIAIRSEFTYTYEQSLQAGYRQFAITEIPIEGRRTRGSRLVSSSFQYGYRAMTDFVRYHRLWKNRS